MNEIMIINSAVMKNLDEHDEMLNDRRRKTLSRYLKSNLRTADQTAAKVLQQLKTTLFGRA